MYELSSRPHFSVTSLVDGGVPWDGIDVVDAKMPQGLSSKNSRHL